MRSHRNIWKGVTAILLAILIASTLTLIPSTVEASPKSLYLVADHHTRQFDAWEIKADGTATYQATYWLSRATDPAGIAIDESSNTLFITSEFSGGVEMVDATTMTSLGISTGPSNLAGIDVDDANDIVYAVRRDSNQLYVYDWDPIAKTLTPKAGFNPYYLPGCSGAFGIALDDIRGILWVADGRSGVVRAYDVSTWTEDTTRSFVPSHRPISIAVDRIRGFVYTVSIRNSPYCCASPCWPGSRLLSKYDLLTSTESALDLGHGGADVAVDEVTGLVYVTGGCDGDNLEVWDTSTSPWSQVQATGVIGRPAGICIPRGEVAYNPLGLTKDDGLADDECVRPGENVAYDICYDNTENAFDVHNVKIVDELPAEVGLVSATGGGTYDSNTHTVIWDIGTLPAGAAQQCVQLVVQVDPTVTPGRTVVDSATIDSNETVPTTVNEVTDICPLSGEIGLEVDIVATPPEDRDYYQIDDTIEFEVTVTNPTDTTGIDVTAYQVRLTTIEPEEIEIDIPIEGINVEDIPSGEFNTTTFSGTAVKAGDNVEVIVKAVGYTDISRDAGKIRGRDSCTITIHDPEAPKPDWSFAIIADLHIGYNKPDYDGETWDDSGPGEDYDYTKMLENAVDKIIAERGPYDIKFAVVLGDFADTAEKSEFLKAREILNRLNDPDEDPNTDDGIPYIPVIGDHDQWPYTQPAPKPGDSFNPENREDHATIASYACGDESFNDVFWSEDNNQNIELVKTLFGKDEIEEPQSIRPFPWLHEYYLQNRSFTYKDEKGYQTNFVCLDFNPRDIMPGGLLGPLANCHSQTVNYLRDHLEQGLTTLILTHHPLWERGGFLLHSGAIAQIVHKKECDGKTYNFAGHTHRNWPKPSEVGGHVVNAVVPVYIDEADIFPAYYIEVPAYEVIETDAVSQIAFEFPEWVEKLVSEEWTYSDQTGEVIRIVQVKDGEIDYSTVLEPKEVEILWPLPEWWLYQYLASYPEPNKEITFVARFTSYYGFETSFDWDFGDGSYGSGLSVTHSYSQDGEYDVTLTVTTKNLITGEEETYSVTRPVYVHTKHVISPLPSELNVTSLLTEEDLTHVPKNTYQPALITREASEEIPAAQLGVHFEEATEDINLSSLVADVDIQEAKSVLYMPSWPSEIEDYKNLFIPSTGAGVVYICKDAKSLDEVRLQNADVVINVGETMEGMTVTTTFYNGAEYYLVSGVTGTGGGELRWIEVSIDIKPGSFPNSINPDGRGVIPVAILTTGDFDATTVDGQTVRFGPAEAEAVRYALEDVDEDGDIDMILHFKTQETGIQAGDTQAELTGETVGGQSIRGTDSVRTVPK